MNLECFYAVDADYVKPYGLSHVIYLVFCFAIVALFIVKYKKVQEHKVVIKRILFSTLLFQQIVLLYGWYVVVMGFDLSESLPLHICRISSLLTVAYFIKPKQAFMDIIFYFSFFALGSLFYPMHVYKFLHINGISYMINHLLTVIIPIFGAVAYGWRPTWKGCVRGIIVFTAYFLFVYWLNPVLDSNYFYIVDRPFLKSWTYPQFGAFAYGLTSVGFVIVTAFFRCRLFNRTKVNK